MKRHVYVIFFYLFIFLHLFCLQKLTHATDCHSFLFEQIAMSAQKISFPQEKGKSVEQQLKNSKENFQRNLINWETSFNFVINNKQSLNRTNKIYTAFNREWQIHTNSPSSFKTIFLIYKSYLAKKIADPRLAILSSRAHPPTA